MTNDLDDQLARTLRAHADEVGPARLDLDAVRGRARRIRRTRAALAAAGTAAVVAVALPLLQLGGTGADRSDDPAPYVTQETEPVERVGEVVVDLGALTEGRAAETPYVLDHVLHLPGGATYDLPGELGFAFSGDVVPLTDGWLVTVDPGRGGEYDLQRLAADGAPVETVVGLEEDNALVDASLAHDPATGRVAWVESDLDAPPDVDGAGTLAVVVADASGAELWRTDVPGDGIGSVSVVGFRGDDVVVRTTTGSVGVDEAELAQLVTPGGEVQDLTDTWVTVVSPDGELLVGTTGEVSPDDYACQAVYRLDDRTPLPWSAASCTATYGVFSPDGRLLLRGPVEEQVATGGQVDAVLDVTTGEPVVDLSGPSGSQTFLYAGAWESPESLLISVQQSASEGQPARYGLVRVDVTTGEAELAAPLVDYDADRDIGVQRFFLK